jgi:hypothetical protein
VLDAVKVFRPNVRKRTRALRNFFVRQLSAATARQLRHAATAQFKSHRGLLIVEQETIFIRRRGPHTFRETAKSPQFRTLFSMFSLFPPVICTQVNFGKTGLT